MTRKQLKRVTRALSGQKKKNNNKKPIDGKTAEKIVATVLADGVVSRTEQRLLGGLLRRERLDNSAQLVLHRVLADGS